MKYRNAAIVLPDILLEELQKYYCGGYLYIPVKTNQRKGWGEQSGYRKKLEARNQIIIDNYQNGTSIDKLADTYFLSIHAIKKIIYQR